MRNSQVVMEIFTNRGYNVTIENGLMTIYRDSLSYSLGVKYIDGHCNVDHLITRVQGSLNKLEQPGTFKTKFLKELLSRKLETWVEHYLKTGNNRIMFPVPEKNQSLVFNILNEIIEQYVTIDIDIWNMEETEIGCDVSIRITNK